jgi:hypothetical protein
LYRLYVWMYGQPATADVLYVRAHGVYDEPLGQLARNAAE